MVGSFTLYTGETWKQKSQFHALKFLLPCRLHFYNFYDHSEAFHELPKCEIFVANFYDQQRAFT